MIQQARQFARLLLPVVSILGLAGCKVGPDYKRPDVLVPGAYAATLPTTQPATQPAAVAELARWWESIDDPQLTDLIRRATRANLDLAIARQRVRESRALRGVAAAVGQPQVSAGASYTRFHSSKNIATQLPGNDLYDAGFDASWELDIFGGDKRAVEAADAQTQSSIENLRDTLVSLEAEVATNYVDLRTNQKRLEVARASAAAQQQVADFVRDRFRAGLSSELDVARANAQVAATESQIPTFEADILASIHRLGVLLGRGPADLIPELTAGKPIPVAAPNIPPGQPGELLRRRPDIRRAEADLWAATANIGVAKSDLYPKFNLLGHVGLQSNQFGNWWEADSRYWTFGPTVSWSILNGGRVNANIQVQYARQQEVLLSYQQAILIAVEEVENALTRYGQEQRRRVILQRATDADVRALQLAEAFYKRGLSDFTTVLDAERTLYIAQDALTQSQGLVSQNALSVYKSLGGGWNPPPARVTRLGETDGAR